MDPLKTAVLRLTTASAEISVSRPVRRVAAILLGSLFVAVCAHVSIPLWFTPVPVTLQTFAVVLLALTLSPAVAASALVLYLMEGAVGLPVLSPYGPVGFLHLFGPTGGYLLAYPPAAFLIGWLRRNLLRARPRLSDFTASTLAGAVGSLLILASGAAWFSLLTHQSAGTVVALAVIPFLPGDILKLIAAGGAASSLRRWRRS